MENSQVKKKLLYGFDTIVKHGFDNFIKHQSDPHYFSSKNDFIRVLNDYVSNNFGKRYLKEIKADDIFVNQGLKDKIFSAMLIRFEIINPFKNGIKTILKTKNPENIMLLPIIIKSIEKDMEMVIESDCQIKTKIFGFLLSGFYFFIMFKWINMEDEESFLMEMSQKLDSCFSFAKGVF